LNILKEKLRLHTLNIFNIKYFMKCHLIIIASFFSFLFAEQSPFQKGLKSFQGRAEGANGLDVKSEPINYAIEEFKKAYKNSDKELEAGIYLMRSYYYKGKYAVKDDEGKRVVFSDGKALGEKLIKKYPKSPAAHYWFLVNLGSWSEVYGVIAAAKEGVANIMRDHAKIIIELDPKYSNGGGYFMLGAIHFKSPYIPFILSWPNNDKAIEYLQKAFEIGTSTPTQTVYLARAMYKNGQKDKAKSLLNGLLQQPLSESETVEDLVQHQLARELLGEWK